MAQSVSLDSVYRALPKQPKFDEKIRRAPKRTAQLSDEDKKQAVVNALRYVPQMWHEHVIGEFYEELNTHGRIYGYRFMPKYPLKAQPIDAYEGNTLHGKAFQLMIDNNLDPDVALYPYELVTYGESGQVFQNWMQYQLVKAHLKHLNHDETLVIASGHPTGVFKTTPHAPRVMITNGLMVGAYDTSHDFSRAQALGVTNYGQMTAGGWMYIGPQGIVHGTYSTLLNAGRLKLNKGKNDNLNGVLFVSSGLGGMSGAQGKAAKIAGGVGLIAEVDQSRVDTRYEQGWIDEKTTSVSTAFSLAQQFKDKGQAKSIAYVGNIVDLLQYAVDHNIFIDLLSDQTSCHNVYEGGYTPQSLTFEARSRLLREDKEAFKNAVDEGLKKHYECIETLSERGTYFFDYGNSFLKAVYDAGVRRIAIDEDNPGVGFIYPSYVEDIMGPVLFDYGYGPFRWVCLSGKNKDLQTTDSTAMKVIDPTRRFQDKDNYDWIKNAQGNRLTVGSKARILYQDAYGRRDIALAFNQLVREGKCGPIMIGRDHHDTGGTDSPFRETSNIKDGSNVTADMAVHVYAGNAARGMSLVALHNGGGVGISKAINGGYGLLLDGSLETDAIIKRAIVYDVIGGVARRSWAGNDHAYETAKSFNARGEDGVVFLPNRVAKGIVDSFFTNNQSKGGE